MTTHFHNDNQWVADRIKRVEGLEREDLQLEPEDLIFLQRLCRQLYNEERMSGDFQRDLAQRLDRIIESMI
jgi:hypothetical protein